MLPLTMKFRAYIVWGAVLRKKKEYGFKTKAEKDAFLLGVSEHDGYMEATVYNDKEDWDTIKIEGDD